MSTYTVPHELASKFLNDRRNRRLVTEENVTIASAFLSSIGVNPTVREVQHVLGGGSTRDVSPLVKSIRANEVAHAVEELQEPGITLDASTIHALEKLISSFASAASASADLKITQLAEVNAALSEELTTAEILAEYLRDDIAACNVQLQQQAGQLAERAAEIVKMQEDAAESLRAAKLNFANERRISDALREEVDKLHSDAAALPELHRQTVVVTDHLRDVTLALQESKQVAAVAIAEKAAEAERAREYCVREQAALSRIQKLEVQVSDAVDHERDLIYAVRSAEKELALAQTRIAVLEATDSSQRVVSVNRLH